MATHRHPRITSLAIVGGRTFLFSAFLLAALLTGCAGTPSAPWTWTQSPAAKPQGQVADAQGAPLPKPQPYPALYIGNPPALAVDAAKKSEVIPVGVFFQDLAEGPPPASNQNKRNAAARVVPDPPAADPQNPAAAMRELYRKAAEKVAELHSYQVRIRRREVINSTQMPEEILVGRFRKEPFSVYFRWVGKEAKGREVIYVKDQYDNKVHTLLAAGDHPLYPAGKKYSLAPDSILLTSRSRYAITDAGLAPAIARFGRVLEAQAKGDNSLGKAEYLGMVKRPEFARELAGVRQTLPPGADPTMPKGGERYYYFDTENQLPVLVTAFDKAGKEVEYYCHDNFWFNNPRWNDDDFNPERLWPDAK